jgi:peptidyl-prolyl cis-trans isomerase A (cyclophilin A)
MNSNFRIAKRVSAAIAAALFVMTVPCISAEKKTDNPVVVIETSMGDINVELFKEKAPKSVENFLSYVKDEFYRGTIFHRVIKGFMIQGGGFTTAMTKKPTKSPIANESSNGLHNNRGTIAMARTADPNSATSQFFINTKDNSGLDRPQEPNGYAVFGKVTQGMNVVDQIENTATGTKGGYQNVPLMPVVIKNISLKASKEK